jgi:hypothetical protein
MLPSLKPSASKSSSTTCVTMPGRVVPSTTSCAARSSRCVLASGMKTPRVPPRHRQVGTSSVMLPANLPTRRPRTSSTSPVPPTRWARKHPWVASQGQVSRLPRALTRIGTSSVMLPANLPTRRPRTSPTSPVPPTPGARKHPWAASQGEALCLRWALTRKRPWLCAASRINLPLPPWGERGLTNKICSPLSPLDERSRG